MEIDRLRLFEERGEIGWQEPFRGIPGGGGEEEDVACEEVLGLHSFDVPLPDPLVKQIEAYWAQNYKY